jgi:hypothetical protein
MGIDEQRLTDAWHRDWRDGFSSRFMHSVYSIFLLPSLSPSLMSVCYFLPPAPHPVQLERDHRARQKMRLVCREVTYVRTSIRAFCLDIGNDADKRRSEQKLSSPPRPLNICVLSAGRPLLGSSSIGTAVRRLEPGSSFTNLELAISIAGFLHGQATWSPGLGAFCNHHPLPVVHFSRSLSYFALLLSSSYRPPHPFRRYVLPFASNTSTWSPNATPWRQSSSLATSQSCFQYITTSIFGCYILPNTTSLPTTAHRRFDPNYCPVTLFRGTSLFAQLSEPALTC